MYAAEVIKGMIRMGDKEHDGGGEHLDGDLALQEAKPQLKKPPLFTAVPLQGHHVE